jgi:hypothetical protein
VFVLSEKLQHFLEIPRASDDFESFLDNIEAPSSATDLDPGVDADLDVEMNGVEHEKDENGAFTEEITRVERVSLCSHSRLDPKDIHRFKLIHKVSYTVNSSYRSSLRDSELG